MVQEHRGEYHSLWAAIESIAPKIGCVPPLRRANEILKLASAFFAQAEPDRKLKSGDISSTGIAPPHGVEPICKVLQIAPSGYRRQAAQQRNPALRSARAHRDDEQMAQIQRVWQANMRVYGAGKVWRQLNHEGVSVARCTVGRLMKRLLWKASWFNGHRLPESIGFIPSAEAELNNYRQLAREATTVA